MIFAASNIAWPYERRFEAYELMAQAGVSGLEIGPPLFFADAEDPFAPDATSVNRAMGEMQQAGLTLVSMQSLLYGVEGAALFEGAEPLARLERGLERVIDLAGEIGVPNLVFGSPRQRVVPDDMEMEAALDHAADLFARLGARAQAAGTVLAIEANPALYGTNFLTDAFSALALVQRIDHPGIRFILDLGERHVNEGMQDLPDLLDQAGPYLSHIHVSEPHLAPAPADADQFATVLQSLTQAGYSGAVSIEMLAGKPDPIPVLGGALDRLTAARKLVQGTA
ncbi:MAG: TIM barrel protein [Rhodobacteraceae bacterium]|nr:TIM barrel protein [Paracoccaceae bacterium]